MKIDRAFLTMNRSKAFTLIELIFVIVVLGILAAIAIPKFNATREDAIISKKSQLITRAMYEIAATSVGRNGIDGNFTDYSNIITELNQKGEVAIHPNEMNVSFKVGNAINCITLVVVNGANEQNLTVEFGNDRNDDICKGVQNILHNITYPIILRGQTIKF